MIRNFTAHDVTILAENDPNADEVVTFETELDSYDDEMSHAPMFTINDVPVYQKSLGTPDLPEPEEDVWLLVSLPTAMRYFEERSDLLVMGELVRNEGGTIVGATNLATLTGDGQEGSS